MRTRFVQDSLNAIEAQLGQRLDAGESLFFERQLEAIEARLYEKKYRELKYRSLIPVSNRDGPGAQTITYYFYTKIGVAKIIANPSDDLPRADVYATRHTQKVYILGNSFGYSTADLRAAAQAGTPLETFKVDASRRAIRELENDIAWHGDADHSIIGLLAHPNIPTVQAPLNGGGASRLWANKTPDEILADIGTLTTGVRDTTNGTHEANTLILPITQYNILANRARTSQSDTTILKFIRDPDNGYGLDRVEWVSDLKGAGTGGSDLAMVYERDPEVLEYRIPMEMITHPPQMRNLEFVVPVEAENGGIVVRYPLALRSMYDI